MRVVIVGAGGMGREAAAWAADAGDEVVGFLDGNQDLHGQEVAGHPVLGDLDWLSLGDEVAVVPALGSPGARLTLIAELDRLGFDLATIVHPSAYLGPNVEVGGGSIICPSVVLTRDITLGRGVIANYGALVGHDCRIGDGVFLGPGINLAGNVLVAEGADVGIGASVIQGVTIGENTVIGGGAVVIDDLPAGVTAVGVPARPRRSS